jgi:magnesium-transporting ATPase (P-type)
MPVCWFCAFDFQYSKEKFLKNPYLYKLGLKNKCFNNYVFFQWYFLAIWQSAVILVLSIYTFEESVGVVDGLFN